MNTIYLNIFLVFICLISSNVVYGQDINKFITYSKSENLITGEGAIINETTTNVSIVKMIDGTTLNYIIKTPKVDNFEFVLALDSSGSFGLGNDEDESQKKAILIAIPKFLEYIQQNYSGINFKVSLISWDNNIDFAFGGYNNSDPFSSQQNNNNIGARMIPLDKIINITKYSLNENNYICREDEHTELSTAIKASLDTINNTPYSEYNRTLRFIILVTGNGEFTNCSNNLIRIADSNNYKIYPIGIQTSRSSMIRKELLRIAGGNRDHVRFIAPDPQKVNDSLSQLHVPSVSRSFMS